MLPAMRAEQWHEQERGSWVQSAEGKTEIHLGCVSSQSLSLDYRRGCFRNTGHKIPGEVLAMLATHRGEKPTLFEVAKTSKDLFVRELRARLYLLKIAGLKTAISRPVESRNTIFGRIE